jgi:2-iminobutanoate/2-iminopropanoate deaminase
MRRRSIDVPGLHHAGAPIPQASLVGTLLLSSGISGMDAATGEIATEPAEQARLVFENVGRVLEAAGGSAEDIVKMTFFVRDRSLRGEIDPHWLRLFPNTSSRPARHTLVQILPDGIHMQCEITANIEGKTK